ncbi:MAG TPA: SDR family NAD(P)-dependent oxidoreductase [Chthoniobacterales bacterium]
MKKIFLTGASSGIGLAAAENLVACGHEVWGTSRNPARLPSLGGFHPVAMDLSNLDSVREAFAVADREAKGVEVVINNAGSGHFDTARSLSPEKIEALFRTLVFAQMELCRLALAVLPERGGGLIINVTSLASRLPVPLMSAYNAAKAAMAAYTFSLQVERRDRRVQVVDLQPADIRTNFNEVMARDSLGADELKIWEVVDRNMREAPPPGLVAHRIVQLVESDRPPPRITVGGFFQAQIAPLIFRVLPQRVRVWGIRRYYGIRP